MMSRHSGTPGQTRLVSSLLFLGCCAWIDAALAQTPPAPEDAPAPAPAEASATLPTPRGPAVDPAPAPATPAPAPPPAAPPPSAIPDGEAPTKPIAPAFPPAIPNIDFGGRLQTALKLQNPTDTGKLNDVSQLLSADLLTSGQIHRFLKWQVSLTFSYGATPGTPSSVNVQPLDVLARIELLPELNIYMGRMLVVVDRFAPSGPWGMDEFFFPGFFPSIAAPAMPEAGAVGRGGGTPVWGAPLKGHIKIYLGAFNLYDPTLNPLLSGRLQVSLLNGEPNFYHRTTYFGTKDLISVGVGGQYQKQGSVQVVPATMPPTVPLTDNYSSVTADLTVEKNIADAGTVSLVGAYYKYDGDYQRWKNFWVTSLGYMLPKPIGIGKVRATVRYQRGLDTVPGADASSLIDAQLSYNVAAWFARFQLGFRHGDTYLAPTATTAARLQTNNIAYFGVTLADP